MAEPIGCTIERFTRKEFLLKYGHEPNTEGIVGEYPLTAKEGDELRVALTEEWDKRGGLW